MMSRRSSTLRIVVSLLAILYGSAAAAQSASPPRWGVQREVVFGDEDGPGLLTEVSDLTIGADGAVYVVQPQEQRIRVFAPDGRFRSSLGRRGRGPGEFQSPAEAGWRGDTLFVTDPYAFRAVGFVEGRAGSTTLSFGSLDAFLPRAVLASGEVLGRTYMPAADVVSGRIRVTALDRSTRATTPTRRPFLRLPVRDHMAAVTLGSATTYFPQPFSTSDLYDVDPAGRWVVSVSRPADGRSEAAFTVTRVSPAGSVSWRARVPFRPAPVPAAVVRDTVASLTEQFAAAFPDVPRGRLTALIRDAVAVPDRLPPVVAIVAGRDGTTWLKRGGTGPTAEWLVLDTRGRTIGTVALPARVSVHAADLRNVWGVELDGMDVPRVVRWRVQRPEGRR